MTTEEKIALEQTTGRIYATETFGTVDGPGIRFVLFLQGCPLRCLYCHNPDSVMGEPKLVWTARQAVDHILKYKTYIKSGGVTFSGGEPLLQPEFVKAVAILLREKGIHATVDTSGCMDPLVVADAIDAVDLVLLDIKAFDPAVALRLTGKDNANAFATLEYCQRKNKPVWIRQVLLEGYTLDEVQLKGLAEYLSKFSCVERVELLPFHKLGEPKWEKVELTYELTNTPATTKEQVAWAKEFFLQKGLQVQ